MYRNRPYFLYLLSAPVLYLSVMYQVQQCPGQGGARGLCTSKEQLEDQHHEVLRCCKNKHISMMYLTPN